MALKVAIITEKLGTYDAQCTTKIALEAIKRGHQVFETYPADISHAEGQLIAKARVYDGAESTKPQDKERIDLAKMDVIHFRPNPPVDMAYLSTLYLLETIKDKVLIINSPESIIKFPEKIFPLQFPEFTPATLITREIEEIRQFAEKHQEIILKPLYEYGGHGIKKISAKDFKKESKSIIQRLRTTKTPLIAQKFLPNVIKGGDKRILFIYGEVAGAFDRFPLPGSYIANTVAGGSYEKTALTAKDKKIAQILKPILQKNGIYICGIDLIDGLITEINITSPAGFATIEELYGEKPQVKLWDIIESKI